MCMSAVSEYISNADLNTATIRDVIDTVATKHKASGHEVNEVIAGIAKFGITPELTINDMFIKVSNIWSNAVIDISAIPVKNMLRYCMDLYLKHSHPKYHDEIVNVELKNFVKNASNCKQSSDAVNSKISTYLLAIGYRVTRNDGKHCILGTLQFISESELFPNELSDDTCKSLEELCN